jgi:hypothetical protein
MSSYPYRDHGQAYLSRGWFPLPLPPGKKWPPPFGWTGYAGNWPNGQDVFEWAENGNGASNIGLRLSQDLLGLDVDAYDGKRGYETMLAAIDRLGPLPDTVCSTSRDDGVSGIRVYRVPAGRCWADVLGDGVEVIHHGHRYIVAAPSTHPDTGATYRWFDRAGRDVDLPRVADLPDLPPAWVEHLDRGSLAERSRKAVLREQEVTDWLASRGTGQPCRYITRLLNELAAAIGNGGSRHDLTRDCVGRIVRAADQGHAGAAVALDTAGALLAAQRPLSDPLEVERMIAGAVGFCVAEPTPEADKGCCPPAPVLIELPASTPIRAAVADLVEQLRTWQHLPDPSHVVVTLAAAATRYADGEPCWLLLVAPPSSGKTEAVRILDDTADARLDQVTSAGLLGWSKGKTTRPSGVLTRIGSSGLVTFGDLSTLLATSDRGGRDEVFGHLRSAYDGHVYRGISPPGKVAEGQPDHLEWTGRLTVIACVTGAIDRYTAHNDQLGPRWIYLRLPERDRAAKQRAADQARRGELAERRKTARQTAAAVLAAVPDKLPELPEEVWQAITDAALVTCWGRGAVPRHGYGRRDIDGVKVVEEPMRLVQQLGALARGILALGLPDEAAVALTRRVALDSMPEARRAVLRVLATGELLSTSALARAAGVHPHVARFNLEELAVIGVVTHDRADDEDGEDQPSTRPKYWFLHGEDGELIADVFRADDRAPTWHETWVSITPLSPEREESTGSNPTLRAKSDAGAETAR